MSNLGVMAHANICVHVHQHTVRTNTLTNTLKHTHFCRTYCIRDGVRLECVCVCVCEVLKEKRDVCMCAAEQ